MLALCECGWMAMPVVFFLSLLETIFEATFQSVRHQNYFFQNFLKYVQVKTFLLTNLFDQKSLIFQMKTIIHSHISSLLERDNTLSFNVTGCVTACSCVYCRSIIHVADNCVNRCNIDTVKFSTNNPQSMQSRIHSVTKMVECPHKNIIISGSY